MKIFLITVFSLLMVTGVAACSTDDKPLPEIPGQSEGNGPKDEEQEDTDEDNDDMKIRITVGADTFIVTLVDNSTAKAFGHLLPITAEMRDLNSNEKYDYLPKNLPTAASTPGTIRKGDLMLYGSNTLVLFYKTFPTSYSYTPIGVVDNPSGLERVLGGGSITVVFDRLK